MLRLGKHRVLTVCQPWAWAIIHGPKRVENRAWRTAYRGPLAIHAGKSRDWLCDTLDDGTPVPHDQLEFGALLGWCMLWECLPAGRVADNPSAKGPWCWLLGKPQPFQRPVPCLGKPGLWTLDEKIARMIIEVV